MNWRARTLISCCITESGGSRGEVLKCITACLGAETVRMAGKAAFYGGHDSESEPAEYNIQGRGGTCWKTCQRLSANWFTEIYREAQCLTSPLCGSSNPLKEFCLFVCLFVTGWSFLGSFLILLRVPILGHPSFPHLQQLHSTRTENMPISSMFGRSPVDRINFQPCHL